MSEAMALPPDSMDVEARAAAFLTRRRYHDWTEANQTELDAWLAASMAHRVAFWRLEATLGRTERLAALHRPASEAPAPQPRKTNFPLMLGIAASIAAVAIAAIVSTGFRPQPQDRTFATALGGRQLISFADGTKIELNTDTVLHTRMTSNQRTVWIEKGEAYFRVKHDPAHPFAVIAGTHRVTDLGTEFLVRRDPAKLEVALVQGRVRFGLADAHSRSKPTLLAPGEVATATPSTMFVTKKPAQALANELSWRHGLLIFDHTTLADAANEFNRYNREKLIVADPAAARLMIDGTFRTNNVKAFTDVVQEVLKLRVRNDGEQVIISR